MRSQIEKTALLIFLISALTGLILTLVINKPLPRSSRQTYRTNKMQLAQFPNHAKHSYD